jgi:hypothetical protein
MFVRISFTFAAYTQEVYNVNARAHAKRGLALLGEL